MPDGWNFKTQRVYGEKLPGVLDLDRAFQAEQNSRIVILLKSGTHRVKWIKTEQFENIEEKYQILPAHIIPMKQLKSLGQDDNTTSFFETSGPRNGHVKGSYNPFEKLLMSWWAMDFYIGEDKEFGHREETGTIFYTSLKFWDRKKIRYVEFQRFFIILGLETLRF